MNSKIVQDQIDSSSSILDHSCHKLDENSRIHIPIMNHESRQTLIGKRRDKIDPFFFRWKPEYRRFPAQGITAAMLAVVCKTGFIPPVNLSLFSFRTGRDIRIILFKPLFYSL
jgi:hypothetical protein